MNARVPARDGCPESERLPVKKKMRLIYVRRIFFAGGICGGRAKEPRAIAYLLTLT
jgi:hypothetical protein